MEINKIILGDCLEIMKTFPSNFIDLVITSPPYNVGMDYGNVSDNRNYNQYLEFMENVLRECYRVLIRGGRIALNCPSSILQSNRARVSYLSIDLLLKMRGVGFLDREIITWVKGNYCEGLTSWGSWKSPSYPYCRDLSEFIIIMSKETHKKEGLKENIDITKKEFMEFTRNVWNFPAEKNRIHPAPFPEELPYRVIKLYSYVGDLVLDPFCGSGTTCYVAKKTGRNYIGIEINPKYVEFANKRLSQEILKFKKKEVKNED